MLDSVPTEVLGAASDLQDRRGFRSMEGKPSSHLAGVVKLIRKRLGAIGPVDEVRILSVGIVDELDSLLIGLGEIG